MLWAKLMGARGGQERNVFYLLGVLNFAANPATLDYRLPGCINVHKCFLSKCPLVLTLRASQHTL